MALFGDLTSEEKQTFDAFSDLLRSWAGQQARINQKAEAINDMYNAEVSAILAQLDAGEEPRNNSGLAGSVKLTKEEFISVMSHLQGILTTYDTAAHRQLWIKSAGAQNVING